jgi:FkbM family methyltransferase
LFAPATRQVEGQIAGFDFLFDFRDELQKLMYFGLYDQAETALVTRTLRAGDVFLDIGANVGYYSLHASRLVGETGQVHAFEPIAANVQRLLETAQRNGIRNVRVNQAAVGEAAGTLELHLGGEELGNSGWASVVPSQRRPNMLTVPMLAIDPYVVENNIRFIRLVKLDVEGAEPEVIAGMSSLLAGENAPDLLCEINPWLLERRGLDSTSITRPLAARGYRLSPVGSKALIDPSRPITRMTNLFGSRQKREN